MKAYIKIDGRWCHVTLVDKVRQVDLFGNEVTMVTFRRNKNSRETEQAPLEQFKMKKPKAEKKHKKEEEN